MCNDFGTGYDGSKLNLFFFFLLSFLNFSSTYLLSGTSRCLGVPLTLARQTTLEDESSYLPTRYPQLSSDSRPTNIIA